MQIFGHSRIPASSRCFRGVGGVGGGTVPGGTPAFNPQRCSLFLSLGSCSDGAGMFQPVSPVCFSNSEKNTGRTGGCQLCFLLYKESFV